MQLNELFSKKSPSFMLGVEHAKQGKDPANPIGLQKMGIVWKEYQRGYASVKPELTEASGEFDHDKSVEFVEGWVNMGDAEEMAEEGASLDDIFNQFWGDVQDDSDYRSFVRKIGLTQRMAREILSNVLDSHHIRLHDD